MKHLGLVFAVLAIAGATLTTANARTGANQTICHRTASTTTPYVKLTVSAKAVQIRP